jgi:hypothetical protein
MPLIVGSFPRKAEVILENDVDIMASGTNPCSNK